MSLFQIGKFQLASGAHSDFRIECDGLDFDDWDAIACVLMKRLKPFGAVTGVPTGGVHLADALERFVTTGAASVLVVDDVWTTGGSMRAHLATVHRVYGLRPVRGAVAFARTPPPDWVVAAFTM